MEDFAEKLKRIRKEKRITQKALGEAVGISEVMIGQYERSLRFPKIEMRFKLANALGVSISDLLSDDEIEDESSSKFKNSVQYLENAGFTIEQDETDQEYDKFQICNKNGTVEVMQKQRLIDLVESVIKEGEEYKEQFIIDKLKRLFS